MALDSGTRLGPFAVVARLGAGGMGEVYRARDTRLGRDVALKVMLEARRADPAALRRFTDEARAAAALSHPGILTVHDVGVHDGMPYLVTELLDGETLRQRIDRGALGREPAIAGAIAIAAALAAAHDHGVVHRDLKPENLFITDDGRWKILDFGVAKLAPAEGGPGDAGTATEDGAVIGTIGYMAPEQVRGRPVDHRADLFALGAVLHEMLCGRRPFGRATPMDTAAAILTDEPPPLPEAGPGLELVVRRCLAKSPGERFQSARDLAYCLEALAVGEHGRANPPQPPRRRWRLVGAAAAAGALALGAAGAALLLARHDPVAAAPRFRRLTFQRGTVTGARFVPGRREVAYSAAWGGEPADVYLASLDGPESRALGIGGARLLSVSRSGELALLLREYRHAGTLARVPLLGGAPRELAEEVVEADWAPDGADLAAIRRLGERQVLELPLGRAIYESTGTLRELRVAPDGRRVAIIEYPDPASGAARISTVDRDGRVETLARADWIKQIAWRGDEVWYTAGPHGPIDSLYAVAPGRPARLVTRFVGDVIVRDAAADGGLLLYRALARLEVRTVIDGVDGGRDQSWLDFSGPRGLSRDGQWLLLLEAGDGTGGRSLAYLRATKGGPAIGLGPGRPFDLSPDGKWVVVSTGGTDDALAVVPASAGPSRPLPRGPIARYAGAAFFPDGRRLLVWGSEAGHPSRTWTQDLGGGDPRPVTAEGVVADGPISPDGTRIVVHDAQHRFAIVALDGGATTPLPTLDRERPVSWSADGLSVFLASADSAALVLTRLELASGHRAAPQSYRPGDGAGVEVVGARVLMTPDGRTVVYSVSRDLGDLFVADDLR